MIQVQIELRNGAGRNLVYLVKFTIYVQEWGWLDPHGTTIGGNCFISPFLPPLAHTLDSENWVNQQNNKFHDAISERVLIFLPKYKLG
jgi:hypothetical protein